MNDISDIALGKLPPSLIDVEEVLIGLVLTYVNGYSRASAIVKSEMFYHMHHQLIFNACEKASKKGVIDIITVVNALRELGHLDEIGGAYKVALFTAKATTDANIEIYSKLILQKWQLRKLIEILSNVINQSYNFDSDPDELIQEVQQQMLSLTGFNAITLKPISSILTDIVKTIEFNISNTGELTGVPTGFDAFDRHTNGLQAGDLVVVAGETSNGKSAWAINAIVNAAEAGYPVGIFSLEMTNMQNVGRMLSSRCKVNSKAILSGKPDSFDMQRIHNSIGNMYELPIYLDDTSASSIEKIEAQIRAMVIKLQVKVVVIDYLQLIRISNKQQNKAQAIGDIANQIKMIARSLNITIILLSQLKRESGTNGKPSISRLKESGDIENAADIIVLVWLPEMYQVTSVSINDAGYPTKNLQVCDIAKGRNYGTTQFPLTFEKNIGYLKNFNLEYVEQTNLPY